MASGKHSANEQMVQLITKETMDLLATIKNDIAQAKSLTEDDRKNCEAICQRAEIEYNRLRIQFLEETLILIDQAMNTSDQQILEIIHRAWSLQLNHVTRQCERTADPLIEVMRILSKNDEQAGKKYWYFLGSVVMSFLLIGTALGFFIAYFYPDFVVKLIGKSIFIMGTGALAATAIAASSKTTCVQEVHVCTNESDQLILLSKPFQNYYNDQTKDLSESQLTTTMKRSIATLNITEDMWQNRAALQSIKKITVAQLKH